MKIYQANALTRAPEAFRDRMFRLRDSLEAIPGVEILKYRWKPGSGPDTSMNIFHEDAKQLAGSDLVVAVLDHPSDGRALEVLMTCILGIPLRAFYSKGHEPALIIPDCIKFYRARLHFEYAHAELVGMNAERVRSILADPIEFTDDSEIVEHVRRLAEEWAVRPLTLIPRSGIV